MSHRSDHAGPRIRIAAVSGSLRSGSFNSSLLRAAAALAPDGVDIDILSLAGMPFFDEDHETAAFVAGPVQQALQRVQRADALLLACPEYNHGYTAALKNVLDWLSRPGAADVLVDKPVAVIGATTGSWGTRLAQAALRQVLLANEVRLVNSALYLAHAARAFDGSGQLVDPAATKALQGVVAALVGAVGSGRQAAAADARQVA